ncbi:MAG TPA: ABC transporter permease [Pyrinomonadaceae bacterium]|nr:ABC transporter permease [Pyrinomonadaceae bacterium]
MIGWLKVRLRALFRKNEMENELDEELRFYLEKQTEVYVAQGMSPEEARAAALREFGGMEQAKEQCRDARGVSLIEELWQDLRYGVRMLLKNPGFTVIVVITLALGIGANSAIFSIVNSILLRRPPYKEPHRLMMVWTSMPQIESLEGTAQFPASAADFIDWRNQNQTFEQIAAFRDQRFNLAGGGEPEFLDGVQATASLLPLLGVEPKLGRSFLTEDDQPGASRVVILSHGLWQRRFASDPQIIGQKLTLNDEAYTVVGVMQPGIQFPSKGDMPAGFQFPPQVDFYIPMAFSASEANTRNILNLAVIGRLKPQVTIAQAQADMNALALQLARQYPLTHTGKGIILISLQQQAVGKVRIALLVFLGAVGFVLLIACANVANLLLTRATTRHKEVAIRSALGASRLRLIRQLLTESLLLALLGGTLGIVLAIWGIQLLVAVGPANLPRANTISVDGQAFGFTLLISLLTGIVFGIAPALQTSKLDLNESLKEGGTASAVSFGYNRLRSLLVVSQVAIALVLLVGAGLMIRSFVRLLGVDPGFNPQDVLTMEVSLPRSDSTTYAGQRQAALFQQVIGRLQTLPGVLAAGAVNSLPLSGNEGGRSFGIQGRPRAAGEVFDAGTRQVSPDYFKAMGIPLLAGRAFTDSDGSDTPRALIINQAFVRHYFPNENPIGKRLAYDRGSDGRPAWREIVGVVKDVKHTSLDSDPRPEMYCPISQFPSWDMTLVIRTTGDPMRLAGDVRRQVLAVNKDQPVHNIRTMEQWIDNSVSQRRFNMLLLSIFAAASLLLAAVGIYSVMAYSVAQRTHEIGVRVTLGASAADVLKLVIVQGMTLVLIGAAVGAVAAFALTRVMTGLLYGVSPTDPATFAMIALLLVGVALAACFVPARRATKVDPIVALRYE